MTRADRESHVPRYFCVRSHEIRVVTVTRREGEQQCQVSAKPRNDEQRGQGALVDTWALVVLSWIDHLR